MIPLYRPHGTDAKIRIKYVDYKNWPAIHRDVAESHPRSPDTEWCPLKGSSPMISLGLRENNPNFE